MARPAAGDGRQPPRGTAEGARLAFRQALGERLRSVVAQFPTRKAAAAVCGVTSEQLGHYLQGRAKPPFEVLVRLAEAKRISLDWLASGEGPRTRRAFAGGGAPAGAWAEGAPPAPAGPPSGPPAGGPGAIDGDLLAAVLEAVVRTYGEEGIRLTAAEQAALTSDVYREALKAGSPAERRRLVEVAVASMRAHIRRFRGGVPPG